MSTQDGREAAYHTRASRRHFRQWVKRAAILIPTFVIALLAAGFIFEASAATFDRRNYPQPGSMFDLGGYRLHIHCMGEGSPAVVLDAASDGFSADWAWVQGEVARGTRVCAYDRAGMGWSEPGPEPRDAQQVVEELRRLLELAAVPGPYVLAGHSVGGIYALHFTARYPDEVAGLVLVDPGHPEMPVRIPDLERRAVEEASLVEGMHSMTYLGLPRLMGLGYAMAEGLPDRQAAELAAFYSRPQHWATLRSVMTALPATYDQMRHAGSVGDRPLIVLSASSAWLSQEAAPDPARQIINELHAEYSRRSTRGEHRILEGSTHGSILHQREHALAVAAAIDEVVTAACGAVGSR
jgi:pimeloyl-ACP methyl ester carboxylesterase